MPPRSGLTAKQVRPRDTTCSLFRSRKERTAQRCSHQIVVFVFSSSPFANPFPLSAVLLDVQCGRINVAGKTMVPDNRKGKLRLCKDTDGLTHLQWGVRVADTPFSPEDDLLVFPREAEMKFISKPRGVFVIKFPDDATRNMFFWSQQPEDGVPDDELAGDVNASLNGEAPSDATRASDPAARVRVLGPFPTPRPTFSPKLLTVVTPRDVLVLRRAHYLRPTTRHCLLASRGLKR